MRKQVIASGSAAVANVEDLLNMGDDDFEVDSFQTMLMKFFFSYINQGFEDIVDNSGDAGDISIVRCIPVQLLPLQRA